MEQYNLIIFQHIKQKYLSPLGIYKTSAKTLDNGHCGEQQRFELTEQNNPTAVCVNKRETL